MRFGRVTGGRGGRHTVNTDCRGIASLLLLRCVWRPQGAAARPASRARRAEVAKGALSGLPWPCIAVSHVRRITCDRIRRTRGAPHTAITSLTSRSTPKPEVLPPSGVPQIATAPRFAEAEAGAAVARVAGRTDHCLHVRSALPPGFSPPAPRRAATKGARRVRTRVRRDARALSDPCLQHLPFP